MKLHRVGRHRLCFVAAWIAVTSCEQPVVRASVVLAGAVVCRVQGNDWMSLSILLLLFRVWDRAAFQGFDETIVGKR